MCYCSASGGGYLAETTTSFTIVIDKYNTRPCSTEYPLDVVGGADLSKLPRNEKVDVPSVVKALDGLLSAALARCLLHKQKAVRSSYCVHKQFEGKQCPYGITKPSLRSE